MCGIVGYIDVSYQSGSKELKLQVLRMANEISHRGPDDTGVWVDEKRGLPLGIAGCPFEIFLQKDISLCSQKVLVMCLFLMVKFIILKNYERN